MKGSVGQYVRLSTSGDPAGRQLMSEIFCDPFLEASGWTTALNRMPSGSASLAMNGPVGSWTRGCLQALYIACWIHHPTEKGSYMVRLSPAQARTVRHEYKRLVDTGELQSRISSHLSKSGASAHKAWNFLKGYAELLIQIEGEATGNPYLFLKCEGHALSGIVSTAHHLKSWLVKIQTGKGVTASPVLNAWAKHSSVVEERAAENYGLAYKDFVKQLGLKGKFVTVKQVVTALYEKSNSPAFPGFNSGVIAGALEDTHALARAMLDPNGILFSLRRVKGTLAAKNINYTDEIEQELRGIAERMLATAVPHHEQVYNEIRLTPAEIDESLRAFRGDLHGA